MCYRGVGGRKVSYVLLLNTDGPKITGILLLYSLLTPSASQLHIPCVKGSLFSSKKGRHLNNVSVSFNILQDISQFAHAMVPSCYGHNCVIGNLSECRLTYGQGTITSFFGLCNQS